MLSPMTGVQTETGVLAGDERMLIDGELQIKSGGATFDVIHPASEQSIPIRRWRRRRSSAPC
jgi:aldehyde dehydrogenase (NAD+)